MKILIDFWLNNLNPFTAHIDLMPMDIYEEHGKLVSQVFLPNFNKDDVKVSIDNGVLEVTAEHQEKEEAKSKRHYFLRESANMYLRRIPQPEGVKLAA